MASQEVLGYVPKPFEERGGGKNKGEGSLVGDYGKLVLEVAKVSRMSGVFAHMKRADGKAIPAFIAASDVPGQG